MTAAKLMVLRVQFLWIDDQCSSGELCTPCLENLLELWQQRVHFALKYLDILVEVDLNTVSSQQQVQLHTLLLLTVRHARNQVLQCIGVIPDGFIVYGPLELVEEAAEEEKLKFVEQQLFADGN